MHSSMIPVVESATVVVTGVVGLSGTSGEEVVSDVEVLAGAVVRVAEVVEVLAGAVVRVAEVVDLLAGAVVRTAAVVCADVLSEGAAETVAGADICGAVSATVSAAVVCVAAAAVWLPDDVSVPVMILLCGAAGFFGGFIT